MNAVDLITSLLAVPSPAPAAGSSDNAGREAFATELAAALAGLAEDGTDVTSDELSAEVARLLEQAEDPVVIEQLGQLLDLLAVAGDAPLQSPLVADLVARFVSVETTVSAAPGGAQPAAATAESAAPTFDQVARVLPAPVPSTSASPIPAGRSFDGSAAPAAPATGGPAPQPVALVARTATFNAPAPGNAGQAISADAAPPPVTPAVTPPAAPAATPTTAPATQSVAPAAPAATPLERPAQAPTTQTVGAPPAVGSKRRDSPVRIADRIGGPVVG